MLSNIFRKVEFVSNQSMTAALISQRPQGNGLLTSLVLVLSLSTALFRNVHSSPDVSKGERKKSRKTGISNDYPNVQMGNKMYKNKSIGEPVLLNN